MKTGKIIFWTIIALLLSGTLLVFGLPEDMKKGALTVSFEDILNFGPGKTVAIDQTEVMRAEPFKRIEILTDNPDLKVKIVTGNDASVHLSGTVKTTFPGNVPKLVKEEKGDTLIFHLEREQQGSFGFCSGNLVVEASLPDSWHGSLFLEGASSEISLGTGDFASIEIRGASGDLSLGTLKTAGSLVLETASGEIALKDAKAGTITIASQSGDIRAGSLSADSIRFSGASSLVEGLELSGKVEATTASGDISLTMGNPKGSITAGTASGRIRIQVPVGTGLDVDAGSISGTISGNLSLNDGKKTEHAWTGTSGDKSVKIRVNAASGDIVLN